MASVVFFRAANVGGYQVFQPAKLARELESFGAANIGAAGTMVIRDNIGETKLRSEILRRLHFEPELMICPAGEVLELLQTKMFRDKPEGNEVSRFVSMLSKPPGKRLALPIEAPAAQPWEIRIVAVVGRFALTLRRPGRKGLYSNEVVEKNLGIPATTRSWNTIEAICKILNSPESAGPKTTRSRSSKKASRVS